MNQVYIPKGLERAAVRDIFSKILCCDVDHIIVCEKIEEIDNLKDPQVLVIVEALAGEFCQSFEIFRLDGFSDLEIAKLVSKYLSCPVLMSDDSLNPYVYWLWTGTQLVLVNVDAEFLDEYNGFKIIEVVTVV